MLTRGQSAIPGHVQQGEVLRYYLEQYDDAELDIYHRGDTVADGSNTSG